jgi:hypothetical protein
MGVSNNSCTFAPHLTNYKHHQADKSKKPWLTIGW